MKEESEKAGLKLNIQKIKIMASSPITSWPIDVETMETVTDFIFWSPKSLQMVTAAMKLKGACSLEGKLWQVYDIKKQRHLVANKGPSSQSYGFSSSHVWMWELDHKESWAPENWCFWIVMLEKTLESPLELQSILKDLSWMFILRTNAEAEAPVLWPPDAESWCIGKDPDAGEDWR